MKRSLFFLGLLGISAWALVGVPEVCAQVPFNDIQTSHPAEGDPNTYWCFDCHFFENAPANDKWVKTEIQLLPFHTAYYSPPGDIISVYYPPGGDLVTDSCPTNCGPCQACHTQTESDGSPVWRNDGTGTDHMGGSKDCLACHPHWDDRYMFYPSGGGTGPSHVLHLADPIKGPKKWNGSTYVNLGCDDCHGVPYPIFADGRDLADTTVCDPCHSKLGAFDGVDDPNIGAKPNWVSPEGPSKIYNASGTGINSGKENWCLGCHDRHEGTSRIAGAYAPPVAGDNVKYGYNISGHGKPGVDQKCQDCHNLGIIHIDGRQRTYRASLKNHRTGYRLSIGSAIPRNYDDTYETGAFNTCTYSCHNWDDLTAAPPTDPVTTGFRGAFSINYCGPVQNWHDYHLKPSQEFLCGDSDYDGTVDSRQTCILCHNVHGAAMRKETNPSIVVANPVMIRDGLLISTPGTNDKVPAFDFKYFEGTCTTVGPQTPDFDRSRWASMQCGDMTGSLSENHVCFGCHIRGTIQYYREPTVTISRVWTADPSTDLQVNAFAADAPVRYKVAFTVAGPPARPCIRAYQAGAQNTPTFAPDWQTPLFGWRYVTPGAYEWALDAAPCAWDKTIPQTASPGNSAAQVRIPLGMYDRHGGTLLDYDWGPIHVFDITP